MSHDQPLIYLDHNATTPVAPQVLDAMLPYLRDQYGNPSSDHPTGRAAARAVAVARAQVAALIGADPAEIIFTSGGTESNNLAIRGTASIANPTRRRIITTVVEHPATTAPLAHLNAAGWTITALPVTSAGTVDAAMAATELGPDVALVTMMLAQNETGAILPVPTVAAAAHAVGALMHTDAAQAIGKIEVNVDALGVDLLSIAGHKCYAPKGVGALYRRAGTPLGPVLFGAGQEGGVRPGTENVPGIVGLGAACELAGGRLDADGVRLAVLRDTLWEQLRDAIPGSVRHTPKGSLPNTLMVSFPDVLGRAVLAASPGLAASTGSACHAGQDTPAATLLAMGTTPEVALGAVRLSLGHGTTTADIDNAVRIFVRGYGDCATSSLR
ncbi:cysteine desulfurase family protein [Pengzhenrongella sp.]|uniref:cysteine desulfurase family protein n=1 Tax=Pengzhenrongella sp. TaxID=2888820 RepID=UPI002F927672